MTLAKKILEISKEPIEEKKGRHFKLSNPKIESAYGVKSFGELWTKLNSDKSWKKFIKNEKIHGWVIDNNDSTTPFKLVSKTGIYGVGKQGGELVNLSAKSILGTDELEE